MFINFLTCIYYQNNGLLFFFIFPDNILSIYFFNDMLNTYLMVIVVSEILLLDKS